MRKTLLSLILAAMASTAANGIAGPMELNRSLTLGQTGAWSCHPNGYCMNKVSSKKSLKSKAGYLVNVDATNLKSNFSDGSNSDKKHLEFEISDKNTELRIFDYGADGLSEGDFIEIKHSFGTEGFDNGDDEIYLNIEYRGKDEYEIRATMDSFGSKSLETYIETSRLNPLIKMLVKRKIGPVIKWGLDLYRDLVSGAEKGSVPDLPYRDLQEAFKDVEGILPQIKTGDSSLIPLLTRIGDKYSELAKLRSGGRK